MSLSTPDTLSEIPPNQVFRLRKQAGSKYHKVIITDEANLTSVFHLYKAITILVIDNMSDDQLLDEIILALQKIQAAAKSQKVIIIYAVGFCLLLSRHSAVCKNKKCCSKCEIYLGKLSSPDIFTNMLKVKDSVKNILPNSFFIPTSLPPFSIKWHLIQFHADHQECCPHAIEDVSLMKIGKNNLTMMQKHIDSKLDDYNIAIVDFCKREILPTIDWSAIYLTNNKVQERQANIVKKINSILRTFIQAQYDEECRSELEKFQQNSSDEELFIKKESIDNSPIEDDHDTIASKSKKNKLKQTKNSSQSDKLLRSKGALVELSLSSSSSVSDSSYHSCFSLSTPCALSEPVEICKETELLVDTALDKVKKYVCSHSAMENSSTEQSEWSDDNLPKLNVEIGPKVFLEHSHPSTSKASKFIKYIDRDQSVIVSKDAIVPEDEEIVLSKESQYHGSVGAVDPFVAEDEEIVMVANDSDVIAIVKEKTKGNTAQCDVQIIDNESFHQNNGDVICVSKSSGKGLKRTLNPQLTRSFVEVDPVFRRSPRKMVTSKPCSAKDRIVSRIHKLTVDLESDEISTGASVPVRSSRASEVKETRAGEVKETRASEVKENGETSTDLIHCPDVEPNNRLSVIKETFNDLQMPSIIELPKEIKNKKYESTNNIAQKLKDVRICVLKLPPPSKTQLPKNPAVKFGEVLSNNGIKLEKDSSDQEFAQTSASCSYDATRPGTSFVTDEFIAIDTRFNPRKKIKKCIK